MSAPTTAPPDQLLIGSFVMLRSGGPVMTVLRDGARNADRIVETGWFQPDGTYQRANFPRDALQEVTPAQLAQFQAMARARALGISGITSTPPGPTASEEG